MRIPNIKHETYKPKNLIEGRKNNHLPHFNPDLRVLQSGSLPENIGLHLKLRGLSSVSLYFIV